MFRGRRRAYNNVFVAVGFDAVFDPGQLPVGQQLSPSAQVETPLFLVDRQFERQHRDSATVLDPVCSVNRWFGRGADLLSGKDSDLIRFRVAMKFTSLRHGVCGLRARDSKSVCGVHGGVWLRVAGAGTDGERGQHTVRL